MSHSFVWASVQAASALLGAVTLAPFEAIRIRTVAQPDYGSNLLRVVQRIIEASPKISGKLNLSLKCSPFLFSFIQFT